MAQRDLTGKRYVYFWVDGVCLETRLEESRHCILVIMVLTPVARKNSWASGMATARASSPGRSCSSISKAEGSCRAQSWPLAMGRGVWKALRQVYGQTRWQRCWVHKTANVLDKLPKDFQPQAKQRLQAIWMAPDRQRAEMAFDLFIATYEAKYPKAAECLAQDREVL